MARELNRLSARKVQTLTETGRHADGGGLYFVIGTDGSRKWVFMYRSGGRRREMGLGPLTAVTLARAREIAAEARAMVAEGRDPLAERSSVPPPRPTKPTFGDVAKVYMAARESMWRNAVHRRQWRQTLEIQCAALWAKPVDEIDTADVLAAIRPLWSEKPETARRIRGRIERVLDAARVEGHRTGENPARWKGHLAMSLPVPARLTRGHHPALPYRDIPAFVRELQCRPAITAKALLFQILTAARPGEVRGLVRSELDLDAKLWTVPAARMKAKRPHRVPLSPAALAILSSINLDIREPDDLVFPAQNGGKLSDMAFNALLRRMKLDVSAHGFRSSFRDWAADETDHPREVAEAALAHVVGDETERAYRRGDALEKRRHLLADWARFVISESGAVSINASKSA